MALEKLTDNVEIHQTLGDAPNSEGMTASDLKAKFDEAAKIIKQFINDRIVPNALDKRGDTMRGVLRLGGNRLVDLPEPKEENDAANKAYVDAGLARKVPAIESKEYPGCYYRMVDGVTEWLNPPMVVGEEYRTTERNNGKVVYAMKVDCGAWADKKQINVNLNGNTWVNIVDSFGDVIGYALPYVYNGDISSATTCLYSVEGANGVGAAIKLFKGTTTFVGKATSITIKYTKD